MSVEQKLREKGLLPEHLELSPDTMAVCGFDQCIIGLTSKRVLVYDQNAMVELLADRDEMTQEDAQEFFDFNIEGAYLGDYTPIFVTVFKPT